MIANPERRKLKIVHTEASLGWGGQEIRVMVELREMARRGHRTFVVAPPDSDLFRRALDFRIDALPLSMRRGDFFKNLNWLADFFRRERIDVVNTHSSRDSWLAGFAARSAGVPLVIKTRHISARVSRGWLTRFAYQRLHDYIITTSKGITEDMVRFNHFDPDCISAVPTGIDLKRFDLGVRPSHLRRELGLPENSILIGMISVLRSWKGHPDLLNAALAVKKRFPSAYFVVVGEGPRRVQIEEQLLSNDLEDFVFLIGHRDDIPQILRDLNMFVMPSYANEGVPQALLQALAMEKPVVASNVGGIPEVLVSGKHGLLCEPQNPKMLADALIHMLENPVEAKQMAISGREHVQTHYSLEVMVGQLEEIYYRTLGQKSQNSARMRSVESILPQEEKGLHTKAALQQPRV